VRFVFLVHRQIETREGKYEDRSEQDQGADNLSFREFHWAKKRLSDHTDARKLLDNMQHPNYYQRRRESIVRSGNESVKVAFGFTAHSGWAALVIIGAGRTDCALHSDS